MRFATAMMRCAWAIETARSRIREDVKRLRVDRVQS
jgi:hypothetical protein